ALLMLPVTFLAVINYYKKGYVDFRIVGVLAIGFVAGGYLGSRFALSVPQETLKKIFAVIMIIIAVKMLFFDKK
ncbi:MAG: sulfite exporter TauE/SafE family protein, partial [Chitinophagaceae bacterium]|nr:sulfite exporter TauE/SafE family protein [Chitinophagaceae bacterium]